MGEVVNVLVAFAVIVFIFRWATSNNAPGERTPSTTLGFRPKHITQEMVDTIGGMFPDIPIDNVRYDLLRTGSVELTSNKILERGFLEPPPPAYYTLYPRDASAGDPARPAGPTTAATTTKPKASLISRYSLEERVLQPETLIPEEQIGGKAIWEDSAEKREASLRERKAQMILAARQRMLAQQQKAEVKAAKPT